MTDELKISYKLYALDANKDGVEAASRERFSRITPFYALVYVSGEPPEGAVEITRSETHRLSEKDEQWLLDCNTAILAEEMKKHESEIAADMKERLERLEKALRAEKEKQGD